MAEARMGKMNPELLQIWKGNVTLWVEYESQVSFCGNTKLIWLEFWMAASQQKEKQP